MTNREESELNGELEKAQKVQEFLLPTAAPEFKSFSLFSYNASARHVGGDYYDYIPLESGDAGVVIADVSGKGVPAGLIMTSFRSALRLIGTQDPVESLTRLNAHLHADLLDEMFVSAVYAYLDEERGVVTLARAGHPYPFYYEAASKQVRRIKSPGLAVGLDGGPLFNSIINEQTLLMSAGDKIILYTDGITEALTPQGDEFGRERLMAAIAEHGDRSASELSERIIEDVEEFTEGASVSDDRTLVIIERK